MKNITIILPGKLPVPETKGGAIESTIQLLIDENEISKKVNITIISTFDKVSNKISKKYKYTNFIWIRRGVLYDFINFFLHLIDIRKLLHTQIHIL